MYNTSVHQPLQRQSWLFMEETKPFFSSYSSKEAPPPRIAPIYRYRTAETAVKSSVSKVLETASQLNLDDTKIIFMMPFAIFMIITHRGTRRAAAVIALAISPRGMNNTSWDVMCATMQMIITDRRVRISTAIC